MRLPPPAPWRKPAAVNGDKPMPSQLAAGTRFQSCAGWKGAARPRLRHSPSLAPLLAGLVVIAAVGFRVLAAPASEPGLVPPGPSHSISNFVLRDYQGNNRELRHQESAKAVVLIFTTTGCPIVQKSIPKIKSLRDRFARRGVIFWLIDSNTEDDPGSVREEAREFGIDLPLLLDQKQTVARALQVKRTAEAVCIETKSWTTFYRGAIDDQFGYGTEKRAPGHRYLENALSRFLAGEKIDPSWTDVKGCLIQFEPLSRQETK